MPYTLNGVGTWYYGKRNVHRLRNVCSQCSAVGDLESHDTTLYFVVLFVPLLPLAKKRVMDSCPACGAHRVMPLHAWDKAKAEGLTGALDRLQENPGDRDAVGSALGTAATFQNEALLAVAGDALATHHPDDAELLATYGDMNGYFAKHDAAASAYIDSLKAAENPRVSEQLGLTLLRLGNPTAAERCFDHVLTEADGERLWMLYQLLVAYQAQGMHPETLALLDRVTAAFPAVAESKDWRKLRQKSEKDGGRGRKVGKSLMLESPRAGLSEGSRLKWLLPLLVLPTILLGFAGWHTWRSLSLADAHPMYLLNGSPKPYTVTVNGTAYSLSPGLPKPVELPEGTIAIVPGAGADGVEPAEVTVTGSFWLRPYVGTRVVLNPDRLAVLTRETTIYSEVPPDNPPPAFYQGQVLYELPGVDHCFEPFPGSVKAKKGATVTKTRLGVVPVTGAESRVSALMDANATAADKAEYGRRWLAIDPDDALALAWFVGTNPAEVALPVLQARLKDRPLRPEWHRIYQSLSERRGADLAKLKADYAVLADELDRDPDALYLLARLSERDEAVALLTEAIDSGRPADRAHYSLGFRKLCEGDYKAAAAEIDLAPTLLTNPLYQPVARDALLAAGRTRDLIAQLAAEGNNFAALRERARVCEIAGDKEGADSAAQTAMMQLPTQINGPVRKILQDTFTVARAVARGDKAAYLAAAGPSAGTVADAIVRGEPIAFAPPAEVGAEADSTPDKSPEKPALARGLALLATPPTDAKHAAAKKAFLDALAAGDRDEKRLKLALEAGDGVLVAVKVAMIQPGEKRVYAAAAARWSPGEKPELIALARKLDFHRDVTSLALRQLLGEPAKTPRKAKP